METLHKTKTNVLQVEHAQAASGGLQGDPLPPATLARCLPNLIHTYRYLNDTRMRHGASPTRVVNVAPHPVRRRRWLASEHNVARTPSWPTLPYLGPPRPTNVRT